MEAPGEVKVDSVEVRIHEPRTTSDPWLLMNGFYESDLYKRAFGNFFRAKKLAEGVSQKEKDRVFLESSSCEETLITYGTRVVDFRFDDSKYSTDFLAGLREYEKLIRDTKKMNRRPLSQDELGALDKTRFSIHSSAAKNLVKLGVAPSLTTGRAIVSLILVDKGLETEEDVRRTTIDKIRSGL